MSVPPPLPDLDKVIHTPAEQLPHNKETEALHKKDLWWQIYLPVWIGIIAVAAVAALIAFAVTTGNAVATRVWADISLVFVILNLMLIIFPLLAIFALAIGLNKLMPKLPPYFKVAQDYSAWLAYKTEWALKYVVEPVLQIRSGVAGLDNFIQTIRKFVGR